MTYTSEVYQQAFWAKSGDFTTGRDPLGLSNSSIATYSRLLPGFNNVTGRLRYYGFYAYLLHCYHQLPPEDPFKIDAKAQYRYIRRAELCLALYMVHKHPDEQSIPGSLFAGKMPSEEEGYYDIKLGADQNPDTKKYSVYWDYSSGAFGQYYAGSLQGLNLIERLPNQAFRFTEERGLPLAQSYRNNLSGAAHDTMQTVIRTGRLYQEQMDSLKGFAVHEIPKGKEWQSYYQLFWMDDGWAFKTAEGRIPAQRKESIFLFLDYLSQPEKGKVWDQFPAHIYQQYQAVTEAINLEAATGWRYYYIHDLIHFALDGLLWAFLHFLDGRTVHLANYVQELTEKLSQGFETNFGITETQTLAELLQALPDHAPTEVVAQINKKIKDKEDEEAFFQAAYLFLLLCKRHEADLASLENYAQQHYVHDKYGTFVELYGRYIRPHVNKALPDFLRNLFYILVNDHMAVAYRKMGNGEKSLLKFLLEEQYLTHIETMKPSFTTPRLGTLLSFLWDLDLIEGEDYKLSTLGKAELEKLRSEYGS